MAVQCGVAVAWRRRWWMFSRGLRQKRAAVLWLQRCCLQMCAAVAVRGTWFLTLMHLCNDRSCRPGAADDDGGVANQRGGV